MSEHDAHDPVPDDELVLDAEGHEVDAPHHDHEHFVEHDREVYGFQTNFGAESAEGDDQPQEN